MSQVASLLHALLRAGGSFLFKSLKFMLLLTATYMAMCFRTVQQLAIRQNGKKTIMVKVGLVFSPMLVVGGWMVWPAEWACSWRVVTWLCTFSKVIAAGVVVRAAFLVIKPLCIKYIVNEAKKSQ